MTDSSANFFSGFFLGRTGQKVVSLFLFFRPTKMPHQLFPCTVVGSDGLAKVAEFTHSQVAVVVEDGFPFARVILRQCFKAPVHGKGVYSVPTRPGSWLYSFDVRVDGKVLKGQVQEKAAAKRTFDDAVAQGRTAAMAVEDKPMSEPGTVHVTLGMLPKDADVCVTLEALVPVMFLDLTGSCASLSLSSAVMCKTAGVRTDVIVRFPEQATISLMNVSEWRKGPLFIEAVSWATIVGRDVVFVFRSMPSWFPCQGVPSPALADAEDAEDAKDASVPSSVFSSVSPMAQPMVIVEKTRSSAGSGSGAGEGEVKVPDGTEKDLYACLVSLQIPFPGADAGHKKWKRPGVHVTIFMDVSASMARNRCGRVIVQLASVMVAVDRLEEGLDSVRAVTFGADITWCPLNGAGSYVLVTAEVKTTLKSWARQCCERLENGTRLVNALTNAAGVDKEVFQRMLRDLDSSEEDGVGVGVGVGDKVARVDPLLNLAYLVFTDFNVGNAARFRSRARDALAFVRTCDGLSFSLGVFGIGLDSARVVGSVLVEEFGGLYVEDVGLGAHHMAAAAGQAVDSLLAPRVHEAQVSFGVAMTTAMATCPLGVFFAGNKNAAQGIVAHPAHRHYCGQTMWFPVQFCLEPGATESVSPLRGHVIFNFGPSREHPVLVVPFEVDVRGARSKSEVRVVGDALALQYAMRQVASQKMFGDERLSWERQAISISCSSGIACPLTAFVAVDSAKLCVGVSHTHFQ